jgi:hypothetical protein
VVVSWFFDLLCWMLPNALIETINARRKRDVDPIQFGEARFDSRTGKQIK